MTKQFLSHMVSSDYALLAACSQSSQIVQQLPKHFWVQVKMKFLAISPNNTAFLLCFSSISTDWIS